MMFIAFFETVAIVWCYGTNRMSANIKDMTGKYPNVLFRICWVAVSPLLILVRGHNRAEFHITLLYITINFMVDLT